MSKKTTAQAITFKTSFCAFGLTILILCVTVTYIIVGARCLSKQKTFIQPMFLSILTMLIVSDIGYLLYNSAADSIADAMNDDPLYYPTPG